MFGGDFHPHLQEIERTKSWSAWPYLGHAFELQFGARTWLVHSDFDPNSHQMGGQLRREVEWDDFVAKNGKNLLGFELWWHAYGGAEEEEDEVEREKRCREFGGWGRLADR